MADLLSDNESIGVADLSDMSLTCVLVESTFAMLIIPGHLTCFYAPNRKFINPLTNPIFAQFFLR
jgi:hypothetical protein